MRIALSADNARAEEGKVMNIASRRSVLCGLGALGALSAVSGCSSAAPRVVRIGKHAWPGYALLSLGTQIGSIDEKLVKIVNTPSASASIRALESGSLDSACLTLDEVLTAREAGLPLAVVAIVDISVGADVLLVPSSVESLAGIRGLRIGAEQTAVGAVMLDAALKAAGLSAGDVTIVQSAINEHEEFIAAGKVDAIVTYEPVKSRLLAKGFKEIFSSAAIPGKIIDTIAVRSDVAAEAEDGVKAIVAGFFAGRTAWLADPARHAPVLGTLLGLPPSEVPTSFTGLELPDLAANRQWFAGTPNRLERTAGEVAAVLRSAGLLQKPALLDGIADGNFL